MEKDDCREKDSPPEASEPYNLIPFSRDDKFSQFQLLLFFLKHVQYL